VLWFNLLFVITEILIYGFLSMSYLTAFLTGLISIILFLIINFLFLYHTERIRRPENLKSVQDCRRALQLRLKESGLFQQELKIALFQLETFCQKETALKTIIPRNSPFLKTSEEAKQYLCDNLKKCISRTLIIARKSEIHRILNHNQKLLSQYDQFVTAVSQLEEEGCPPDLELMTTVLQELKEESS